MTMLHAFIDPSVLLRFYSYSDDALSEVEKITALVQSNSIKLYVTEQIVDERARNRDKQIADSLKQLNQISGPVQMPRFAEHHEAAKKYLAAMDQARSARKELALAIDAEIAAGELRADGVIQDLFEAATALPRTDKIIEKARLRRELGNPPGKRDSLGDQINWETLLDCVPDGVDLHLVVKDADYQGVSGDAPNFFLRGEWNHKKKGKLALYSGLASFTKAHFPEIKVPSDALKGTAIKELAGSGSYQWTHKQVAVLDSIFSSLTLADAIVLFRAFIDNDQIHDIQTDSDVHNFYKKLYAEHGSQLDMELESELWDAESDKKPLFSPF